MKSMNKEIELFARTRINELLKQCTEPQQKMFKLMYGRLGGKRSVEDTKAMPIEAVVAEMESTKFDNALDQIERTITKNNRPIATS